MKTHTSLLCILCFWAIGHLQAQEIKITTFQDQKPFYWRPSHILTNDEILNIIPTDDKDFVYNRVIRDKEDQMLFYAKIQKSNGKTIWEKEIQSFKVNDKKNTGRFCHLEKLEDGFCIFYTKEDANSLVLTAQKLSEAFLPVGEKIILTKKDRSFNNFADFVVSRNAGLLLFYQHRFSVEALPTTKTSVRTSTVDIKNLSHSIVLIDNKLNVLLDKEVSGPKDKYAEIEFATVSKDKNIGIVFKYPTNTIKYEYDAPELAFSLTRYDFKKSEFTNNLIDFDGKFKFIIGSRITYDENSNTISISGGYHRTKGPKTNSSPNGPMTTYYSCEGLVNIEYDLNTGERLKYQFTPFSNELLNEVGAGKALDRDKLPTYPSLLNKMNQQDGSNTFVYKSQKMVLIISITSSGEIRWFKSFTNKGYNMNNFLALGYNNITYLAFDASEKIALAPDKKGYFAYAKGPRALVVLAFDDKGNLVNTKVTTIGEGNISLTFDKTIYLDENKRQLEFYDYDKDQTFRGFLEVR